MVLEAKQYQDMCLMAGLGNWVAIWRRAPHAIYFRNRLTREQSWSKPDDYEMITVDEQLVGAVLIQWAFRRHLARYHKSATKVQCAYRSYCASTWMVVKRKVQLQRAFRWHQAQRNMYRIQTVKHRTTAVTRIQRHYLFHLIRRQRASTIIARWSRRRLIVRVGAAIVVQCIARRFLCRLEALVRVSVVKIQALYRGYSVRCWYRRHYAAIVLQCAFRCSVARSVLHFWRNRASQSKAFSNMSRAETIRWESAPFCSFLPASCAKKLSTRFHSSASSDAIAVHNIDFIETTKERFGFIKLQM
jgi:hypothetical protein